MNNLLLGQIKPKLEPIKVNRSIEQEVEKILGVRLVRRKLRYRVKQKGFDDDLDKYSTADLRNTLVALQQFYYDYPNQLSLLYNLQYQLDYVQKDINTKDRVGDNLL